MKEAVAPTSIPALTCEYAMKTKTIFRSILLGLAVGNSVSAETNKENQIVTPSVVNGSVVPKGKYKFVVALQRSDADSVKNPTHHTCGATLLSPKYILTVAHCVAKFDDEGNITPEPRDTSFYTAIAGMTTYGTNQGQKRQIKAIHIHPLFLQGSAFATYDVAVLELDRKVRGLPKIKLPKFGDDAPGTVPTIAGWGSTVAWYPDYVPPQVLPAGMRSAALTIQDNQSCSKAYEGYFDGDVQVCAYEPAVSGCQGDSGGPLFRKIKGQFVQVGIVSWGSGCAVEGSPEVFTRVSNPSIQQFIKSVMNPPR
jgi:secreted trypsin-like serine protease